MLLLPTVGARVGADAAGLCHGNRCEMASGGGFFVPAGWRNPKRFGSFSENNPLADSAHVAGSHSHISLTSFST